MAAVLLLAVPVTAQAAEGDIIVQRAPGLDAAERADLRADAGVDLVKALPIERTELVSAADPAGALAALRADDDVVYAEPDRLVHVTRTFDDPAFSSLWALENTGQMIGGQLGTPGDDIDAVTAWDKSEGAGVTVAVVDTGIASDARRPGRPDRHQRRRGRRRARASTMTTTASSTTSTAGTSSSTTPSRRTATATAPTSPARSSPKGQNTFGVVGVAPQAKILPLRVLDNGGTGWTSDIANAFAYAGDQGVRIVNASLGGGCSRCDRGCRSPSTRTRSTSSPRATTRADADTDGDAFPCALPQANLICVGASDNRDQVAGFSNYGDTAVDLFAPGVRIYSTLKARDVLRLPRRHLDGVAARRRRRRARAVRAPGRFDRVPALRAAALRRRQARPGTAWSVTGGRLNASGAVTTIEGPEPSPTPTPTPEPPVETPTPEPPAPPPPVAPAPTPDPVTAPALTLTQLKVSGSLRGSSSKLRVGFRLSRSAWVRYTVQPKGSRTVSGTWTKLAQAGSNTVLIRRKLPSGKTLKRGSYTLTVTVSPTAAASKVIRVR